MAAAAWFLICAVQAAYLVSSCTATTPPSQVEQVVTFARTAAERSIGDAEALLAAVKSGDAAAAKAAYVKLRPAYEQIEHLYAVLGDTDRDIDARPDVYPYGEAYVPSQIGTPGSIFKGSHRIETLLYRDNNITAAVPWAEQLVADYKALVGKLKSPSEYSAPQIFAGIIEVAREVAKKKISSEEETWSDQSVLIFYNNLQGISEMFKPWSADLAQANATLANQTDAAIQQARATLLPYVRPGANGSLTYAPYSAVPVAVRRKIQTSFYDVAESLEQAAKALNITLPTGPAAEGEAEAITAAPQGLTLPPEEVCTPTVNATLYTTEAPEIQAGLQYFRSLLPYQIAASQAMTKAISSGDVAAAKALYAATRPIYEQIEVLAPSFPYIDAALDAREYAFPEGERSKTFMGFHRLERMVIGDGDVGPAALEYAKAVEEYLRLLDAALGDTTPERFTSATAFEGMLNLANEVPAKKISSEEETTSDLSQMIFYNNWKGILSQAQPFCPRAQAQCEALQEAVKAAAECLDIDTKDTIGNVNASDVNAAFASNLLSADYKRYSNTTVAQRRCIVQRGYAVRDKLAAFVSALGVLDDCSPYYEPVFVTYPFRLQVAPPTPTKPATAQAAAPAPAPVTSSGGCQSMAAAASVGLAMAVGVVLGLL